MALNGASQLLPSVCINTNCYLGFIINLINKYNKMSSRIIDEVNDIIDINFNIGSKHVAEFYINKTGANLDNLDLSISLTQVEKLFDIIKDLSVSGNINISTKHIQVGKKATGNLMVKIDNISSGLSRANPLGSYVVVLTTDNGNIQVSSAADSILNLDGTGSTDSLILEGRIRDDRREDMMQFITLMGIPKPNGAYQLKIF